MSLLHLTEVLYLYTEGQVTVIAVGQNCPVKKVANTLYYLLVQGLGGWGKFVKWQKSMYFLKY